MDETNQINCVSNSEKTMRMISILKEIWYILCSRSFDEQVENNLFFWISIKLLLWASLVCCSISVAQCVEIRSIWRAHNEFDCFIFGAHKNTMYRYFFEHTHLFSNSKQKTRFLWSFITKKNLKLTLISIEDVVVRFFVELCFSSN